MDQEIPTLTLRALRRILRATEIGSRKIATTTGLTPSQLLVLREIAAHDAATPSMVASRLKFSQATITAIVDRLVALGYAARQRSERDKRQVHLSAEPAGIATLSDAPDILQTTFTERFGDLPRWEQAMILTSVEKLAAILGAEDLDAAPLLDAGAIDRSRPV